MDSEVLGAADLAGLAEVTEAEIGRMVDLGVLVPREGPAPFRATDMQKVRLATACERAGLPMDAIAAAIRGGRLSFAFMEAAPYQRFAVPSTRSFRQVSQDFQVTLAVADQFLEAGVLPSQFLGSLRVVEELRVAERGLDLLKPSREFLDMGA